MAIVMLNDDNFEAEVLQAGGTVLVDFYADWCGPCKMQGPIIDALAAEVADVKFCKLNVDEAIDTAREYGVMSIPTIMIVKNGQVTFKEAGLMQKDELKELF
ncbi:MAG: thioredoxin [Mogibacterium sp.]|nr:thioredoxin [Mogibacterium sp.]